MITTLRRWAGSLRRWLERGPELEALVAAAPGDFLLVDVREPNELAAGTIPGAICLPLSQLHARMTTLPRNKHLVVYCQTGMRSRLACRRLRQAGYEAHNLKGGYLRWLHTRPAWLSRLSNSSPSKSYPKE